MEIWSFFTFLLVGILILKYLKQLWSSRHYPPGPFQLPLIGTLWRIGRGFRHDIFMKLAEQYGDIFTLWMGHRPVVVLTGFEVFKEVLINHSKEFSERLETPFLTTAGKGKGIAFSNGHTWKQQKHFCQVTLRKLGKESMEGQIEEESQQLVEVFAREKGQPFDPALPIMNSVTNMLCAMTLGDRFPLEDENFKKLIDNITYSFKFTGSLFYFLYEMFPWLMDHLPGPHKETFLAVESILSFVKKEIQKHKEQKSFQEPRDFIDFYLLEIEKDQMRNDPTSTYDEENLAQDIFDLISAGAETTTTSLKWAILLLANHPDIQDKAYKEIEDVLSSSFFCYQDLKRLPYTNAVLHEILRSKYPSLFGAPRQSATDVKIRGFLIPKGAIIVPDVRSALLDPKHWESPREFNPKHFLDQGGHFVAREEYLAFGAGARVCVGEQVARMEIFIFLVNLLRAFRFQLPPGVKELNEEPEGGFVTPPHPYKVCAVPRCSSS